MIYIANDAILLFLWWWRRLQTFDAFSLKQNCVHLVHRDARKPTHYPIYTHTHTHPHTHTHHTPTHPHTTHTHFSVTGIPSVPLASQPSLRSCLTSGECCGSCGWSMISHKLRMHVVYVLATLGVFHYTWLTPQVSFRYILFSQMQTTFLIL